MIFNEYNKYVYITNINVNIVIRYNQRRPIARNSVSYTAAFFSSASGYARDVEGIRQKCSGLPSIVMSVELPTFGSAQPYFSTSTPVAFSPVVTTALHAGIR